MKAIKFQLLLAIIICNWNITAQIENSNYEVQLAKELGADDYEMKMYTLVLLTTRSNQDQSTLKNEAFATHMQNMNLITDQCKLILAGSLGKNDGNYRGIFVLNTTSIEETKQFLAADLAIQHKYLKAEYIP